VDQTTEATSAIEILSIVRQFIQTRELLNAVFNQSRDSMTTLLLDVEQSQALLIFDASNDPALNRKMIASGKVIFTGSLRGTKVRFSSEGVKETQYRGTAALAIKMPRSITRFQNRGTFRVKASGASCALPVPGMGIVKIAINEISVGGVLLLLNSSADRFMAGQIISGCQIELAGFGKIPCGLEVRRIKRSPGRGIGIGCRFVGMSSANEALVARFVAQEERKSVYR